MTVKQPKPMELINEENNFNAATIIEINPEEGLEYLATFFLRYLFTEWGRTSRLDEFLSSLPPTGTLTLEEAAASFPEIIRNSDELARVQEWLFIHLQAASEYIGKHLPDMLTGVMEQVHREAMLHSISSVAKKNREKLPRLPAKVIEDMISKESAKLKERLDFGPGGPNREPDYPWDDKKHIEFARKVNDLRPLWEHITDFFERLGYDAGSVRMVKESSQYQSLSKNCNLDDDLIKRVFQRQSKRGPEYTPFAFALEHARRECEINVEYKFSTLKKRYETGKKLLIRQCAAVCVNGRRVNQAASSLQT